MPENTSAAEPSHPGDAAPPEPPAGTQPGSPITAASPPTGPTDPGAEPTTGMPRYPGGSQFPAPPLTPGTAQPGRRSAFPAILGIVAATVVLLGGIAVVAVTADGRHPSGSAAAPVTNATTSRPPVTSAASPTVSPASPASAPSTAGGNHSGDLAKLLIPMPAGARPWPNRPAQETLDLTGASAYGTDANLWRELLYSAGFSRGIVRRWVTRDGWSVKVTLFQFETPAGARTFCDDEISGTGKSPDWKTMPGTPVGHAQLFITPTADAKGYVVELGVTWVADIFVHVLVAMKEPPDKGAVDPLLTAEVALLS